MDSSQNYISEKVRNSGGDLINPSTEDRQEHLAYTLDLLLDSLQYGTRTAPSKTLRIQLDPDLTHNVGTVTTVANVTNVQNTVRQGDLQMSRINEAQLDAAYLIGFYNNLIF